MYKGQLLDLKPGAGRAATAPKLEVDSAYVARCAKLLAAESLLPGANGAQTENHGCSVIAWAATLSMFLAGVRKAVDVEARNLRAGDADEQRGH